MPREFEIRREVVLEATPEQVWRAVATPEGQAAWLFPPPEDTGGMAAEADEPHRLFVRTPAMPDGSFQAFEYVIEGRGGGTTVLRFVHSGMLGDDWGKEFTETTGHGWDMYLHTLAEYLRHFAGRRAVYVTADGPAASAPESAWPVLLGALGLGMAPVQGEGVRLVPDGLEPIDGVADWVGPAFLGVRAEEALYRFHGRAMIGMPIAVGHHLYTDADAARESEAWATWLAKVFA